MDRLKKTAVAKGTKQVFLFDADGAPYTGEVVHSATGFSKVYYKGKAEVGKWDKHGKEGEGVRTELVRAQIPWFVTLMIYHSEFDTEPTPREYYVYSPMEESEASKIAMRMWQRWEKPKKEEEFNFEDMRKSYPMVSEAILVQPISDADYQEHWKDVRGKKHRCAGDPNDPIVFTCLDQDVMVTKKDLLRDVEADVSI